MKKCLLFSGGIDSTVAAYFLAKSGTLDTLLLCNYGQATLPAQIKIASRTASDLGLDMLTIPVQFFPSAQLDRLQAVDTKPIRSYNMADLLDSGEEYASLLDFVEGRNTKFFVEAAEWCVHNGYDTIYNGFQYDQEMWERYDEDGYLGGDTGVDFVESLNVLFETAFIRPIKIESPFLDLRFTKRKIIALGLALGVTLSDTYSCEYYPPCGKCAQCQVVSKFVSRENSEGESHDFTAYGEEEE